jgi:hypothetical protein
LNLYIAYLLAPRAAQQQRSSVVALFTQKEHCAPTQTAKIFTIRPVIYQGVIGGNDPALPAGLHRNNDFLAFEIQSPYLLIAICHDFSLA